MIEVTYAVVFYVDWDGKEYRTSDGKNWEVAMGESWEQEYYPNAGLVQQFMEWFRNEIKNGGSLLVTFTETLCP